MEKYFVEFWMRSESEYKTLEEAEKGAEMRRGWADTKDVRVVVLKETNH